jgi:hypothetical protein
MAQAQLHARTLVVGSDSKPHEIPGFGAIPGSLAARPPEASRVASTWALTLTAVVDVEVAVDVEPIVDLDVDLRVESTS